MGLRFSTGFHLLDVQQIKAFARQFDPQPFHLDEGAASNHTNSTCTVGALCAQQTRAPPEGDAHVTIIVIRVSRNPCALSAACRKRHPP